MFDIFIKTLITDDSEVKYNLRILVIVDVTLRKCVLTCFFIAAASVCTDLSSPSSYMSQQLLLLSVLESPIFDDSIAYHYCLMKLHCHSILSLLHISYLHIHRKIHKNFRLDHFFFTFLDVVVIALTADGLSILSG